MSLLEKLFGKNENAESFNQREEVKKAGVPGTVMLSDGEKKYFTEYDSGVSSELLAEYILNDPCLPELRKIIIGVWDQEIYDADPGKIFTMMINNQEKFQHIESLFIGDMEAEENEISWIKQGNYEELLRVFPNLKSLTIQGSDSLVLGKVNHLKLEELVIICGGLPISVVNEIKSANLPNLKKLILYSGDESYGYSCNISDFAELVKKERFPNLQYLGLVNSFEQDDLVRVIIESDLLPQLEIIDISCGCLTDKGGQLILNAADKLVNLKELNADYHYMSEDMMEKIKALPFKVSLNDAQEPYDDGEMWPMITE